MKEGREGRKEEPRKEGEDGVSTRQTEVLRSDPIAIYRFSIKSDVMAKTVEDMEVLSFDFITVTASLSN